MCGMEGNFETPSRAALAAGSPEEFREPSRKRLTMTAVRPASGLSAAAWTRGFPSF